MVTRPTLIAFFILLASTPSYAARQRPVNAPASVVAELYKVHDNGNGPIFQTGSKKYLVKYFDAELADLIWKDLTGSPEGEVGNLSFDPLYYSQDIEIRNFRINNPQVKGDRVVVTVSFNNYDQKTTVRFRMRATDAGWKVENVVYEDGSDLISILRSPR